MTIVQGYHATGTEQATSGTPLYFELNTDPDPVRISPSSGDPERADFVVVGSRRGGQAIACRKITIAVPTGPNASDLTPDITSIAPQISLKDWTPRTDPTAKTITFTPTAEYTVIGRDEGVTIQLMDARINSVVGSTVLVIAMEWREVDGDGVWETGSIAINVGKFPPDFVLENFTADQLIIDNGDSVRLTWEAGGVSSLKLLYDVAEIDVTNKATYTAPNITRTTVFYLRGTVQEGSGTVERTLSVTVTVRVPDLTVRRLTVIDELCVGGTQSIAQRNLGVDPEHPLEHMLDGSPDTYYMSTAHQLAGCRLILDRGEYAPPFHTIEILTGTSSGTFPAGGFKVYGAQTDGTSGWTQLGFSWAPEFTFTSPDGPLAYRYLHVTLEHNVTHRLAVRSFTVSPAAVLRLDAKCADFGVPIKAQHGVD
ncbi:MULTISPECIES: hypothetical protein [unclassified Nocardia]|uniref:hypothetical protein n=1 Tax=unclassified Nocardia TaxID=2637762 RepID=UPI0033A25628